MQPLNVPVECNVQQTEQRFYLLTVWSHYVSLCGLKLKIGFDLNYSIMSQIKITLASMYFHTEIYFQMIIKYIYFLF